MSRRISWTDEEDLDHEDLECLPHGGNVFIDTKYKRYSSWSLNSMSGIVVVVVFNVFLINVNVVVKLKIR